eukprot:3306084-Amphidinium_carterae.1
MALPELLGMLAIELAQIACSSHPCQPARNMMQQFSRAGLTAACPQSAGAENPHAAKGFRPQCVCELAKQPLQ